MWGKRKQMRDYLRETMHGIRGNPTVSSINNLQSTCAEYDLGLPDVGTTAIELMELEREAYRREAERHLAAMRKDEIHSRESLAEIVKLLDRAGRPRGWASIGTTWQELRDLYHRGLRKRAKEIYARASQKMSSEVEELLIFTNADVADLHVPTIVDRPD